MLQDFDGDGKDDLFLATGASWWMMSAARLHWVYLGPYTERLDQLRLGDFDGDRRCDVLAINHGTNSWEISSGGRGTWTALPGNYPGIGIAELATGDFDGDHVTDVFRRAPDGQWWAISPGHYGWTALQSSSQALDHLKLADFDGDGITDVLGSNAGKWAISWSARTPWQSTGSGLSDDLSHVYVANIDGVAGADVVRYVATDGTHGRWDIASGARTGWQTLASYAWPTVTSVDPKVLAPAYYAKTFLGNFDGWVNSDVLLLEPSRTSRLFSPGRSNFTQHGAYAY